MACGFESLTTGPFDKAGPDPAQRIGVNLIFAAVSAPMTYVVLCDAG